MQSPHQRHRQYQDSHIGDDIRDASESKKEGLVEAASVGDRFIPQIGQWSALQGGHGDNDERCAYHDESDNITAPTRESVSEDVQIHANDSQLWEASCEIVEAGGCEFTHTPMMKTKPAITNASSCRYFVCWSLRDQMRMATNMKSITMKAISSAIRRSPWYSFGGMWGVGTILKTLRQIKTPKEVRGEDANVFHFQKSRTDG